MRKRTTVLDLAIARGGYRKARKALVFSTSWAIAEAGQPASITIEEYAEWWRVSRATAYREWAVWKEVFPEWPTPSALFDVLGIERTGRGKVQIGGLAVPEGEL